MDRPFLNHHDAGSMHTGYSIQQNRSLVFVETGLKEKKSQKHTAEEEKKEKNKF